LPEKTADQFRPAAFRMLFVVPMGRSFPLWVRNCHKAPVSGVFEVMMAAGHADQLPAVVLEHPDETC
jgi:hypothetical protein